MAGDVAAKFLAAVVGQAQGRDLPSDEHFSVDGTLVDAWVSVKSLRPKEGDNDPPGPGRNSERDFRGEKRSNRARASTTDPQAKLYRKANGQSSRLGGLLPVRWTDCLAYDTFISYSMGLRYPRVECRRLGL